VIRHEVLTTEKVPFTLRVAGMGARFLAWLIDLGLMFCLLLAGAAMAGLLALGREGLGQALLLVWLFVLMFGYFLFFEWLWRGQTPGKHILGIRVVQWDGTTITFFQAALRNLLRVADTLPLPVPLGCGLVGFVVAASNREHRRLGDLAAGTLVVHVERRRQPLLALPSVATSDRAQLSLWRQRLGQLDRAQKQTLLDLCLRRDQLETVDRARLFQLAAGYLHARLDLAPEPYESPEKFVLQVGAILGERAGESAEPASSTPGKRQGASA
jgi:uncharacterized RDD family membrane protein YckC